MSFRSERGESIHTIKDAAAPGNNRRPDSDSFPVFLRGIFLGQLAEEDEPVVEKSLPRLFSMPQAHGSRKGVK
jgi:hypothetical protein